MKTCLKRFVGMLCSFACLLCFLGNLSPLSVSATTIYGDADNSGTVNISDVIYMSQYLGGSVAASSFNLKYADVDKNTVIDTNDIMILLKYLAGSVNSLPYSTGTMFNYDDYSVPTDASRSYVKYNCSTGNTTNYTLNTPSVMNPAPDPLRSGNIDDRIPDSSDNAQCIVKLSFKQSNGNTYTGTGFIINNHIIATCAHCLYSRTYDTFNTNYTIKVFNEAGTSVVATYSADELHIPYKYCNDHNTNYDYGLIYVDDNLSQYGQMELGLPTNNFKNTAQTVYISGFPGSVNGSGVTGRYFGAGIVLSTSNNYVINTRAYASSGDSGGPVFLEYSLSGESFRVAVGICKSISTDASNTKYSSGIRMTLPVLRFLKNNANVGS